MLVAFRQGTYTKFIEKNITPENGCICFVKRRNPRRNFFVIGNGEDSFIKLAKPNPLMLLYVKVKVYLREKKEKKEDNVYELKYEP